MPVATHGSVKGLTPRELARAAAPRSCSPTRTTCRSDRASRWSQRSAACTASWVGTARSSPTAAATRSSRSAPLARVREDGVDFRSHLDGSAHFLAPEDAVRIQEALGIDVAMLLDECPPAGAPRDARARGDRAQRALGGARPRRSLAGGSGALRHRPGRHRSRAPRRERARDSSRSASTATRSAGSRSASRATRPGRSPPRPPTLLPADRPRYFMGIGTPRRPAFAWRAPGIDLFDCVLPTRNARNGTLLHQRRHPGDPERSLRSTTRVPSTRCALLHLYRTSAAPTCATCVMAREPLAVHAQDDAQRHLLPDPDARDPRRDRRRRLRRRSAAGVIGEEAQPCPA